MSSKPPRTSESGASDPMVVKFQSHSEIEESTSADTDAEEIEDIDEKEEPSVPFDYDITSYGADYPVDGLVKRLSQGDIVVPTFGQYSGAHDRLMGFQREYVWSKMKADRFIESLLLGLPVPGIFLVREKSRRFLVLDGQQRLRTLQAFYDAESNDRKYRLSNNIHDNFRNKRYQDLDAEDRRNLDNSIIHATIVQQDQPTDDQNSIYMIFERLNTGGVNLQAQEIRVALFHGKLAQVLQELNQEPNWRTIYDKTGRRLKDMEMVLRFFAFYYLGKEYKRPMKNFLNRYMGENRNLERHSKAELQEVFGKTALVLNTTLGKAAFRPEGSVNAAAIDSVMTGVAMRLRQGAINDLEKMKHQHKELFSNQVYIEAVKTGTSEEAKVETRMRLAREAFAEVG